MDPTNEELIEELEDAKTEVYQAYRTHLSNLESMRDNYPLGMEPLFEEIKAKITKERDDIIEALDLLIKDRK